MPNDGVIIDLTVTPSIDLECEALLEVRCECGEVFCTTETSNTTCPACYRRLDLVVRESGEQVPREQLTITENPFTRSRNFECPECGGMLPFDEQTECDKCGAHLELQVATVAPPAGESE